MVLLSFIQRHGRRVSNDRTKKAPVTSFMKGQEPLSCGTTQIDFACKVHSVTHHQMRVRLLTGRIPVIAYVALRQLRDALVSPFDQLRLAALALPAARCDSQADLLFLLAGLTCKINLSLNARRFFVNSLFYMLAATFCMPNNNRRLVMVI
jgi:hypothetical protein